MQDIYQIPSERGSEKRALNRVVDFFFALESEAKETFFQKVHAQNGFEAYDILKNYSSGLKLLDTGFPIKYQNIILQNIIPFLNKEQSFELMCLECKRLIWANCHFGKSPQFYNSDSFCKSFLQFVQKVDVFDMQQMHRTCFSEYEAYKMEGRVIFEVEKIWLLQILCTLFNDCCDDLEFIRQNFHHKQNSIEKAIYEIPFMNIKLHIAYMEKDEKGNERFIMKFKPEPLQKTRKALQKILAKHTLPTITGKFQDLLQSYIAEQTLLQDFHLKNTNNALALARYDSENILGTYQKSNKLFQTMNVNMDLQLRVGKLQTNIGSNIFRQRLFALIKSSIFGIVITLFGFYINLWTHIGIGLFITLNGIYEFFKFLRK